MMVNLTHPRNDPRERMMFVVLKVTDRSYLEAAMDDSGSHDGAPVSVIAGYFGGHRRWLEFEDRWRAVLARYEVSEFHAKPFWNRDKEGTRIKGEYKGWSNDRAESFLDELLRIIESSERIFPFACAVENEQWEKQTEENKRIFSGASHEHPEGKPSKSMFLAFQRCVTSVADYCNPGIRAHYIFDDDHGKNSVWAAICYGQLKQQFAKSDPDIYSSIGQFSLADSVDAPPLQAADLLSYEAKKYAEHFLKTGRDDMRERYIRALTNIRSREDFWLFDQKRFDSWQRRLAKL
jgi:Protein of unknown function (DUF3800)